MTTSAFLSPIPAAFQSYLHSSLIDENTEYARIEEIAFDSEHKLLKRVSLFDFYKGKNIPQGKKSYAVSFYLQDRNKTLTDKEIDRIMSKITENLVKKLNAELR